MNFSRPRRFIGLSIALAVAAFGPSSGHAQGYPVKPLRLIVGFPPGGPTDIVARIVAQKMSAGLGQQVFVDNRAGAAGTVGADAVAKAPGDGYTLLRLAATQSDTGALGRAFASYDAPFTVLDIPDQRPRDIYGYDLLLLRPDLHVVWRGNHLPDDPVKLAALANGH